MRLSCPGCRGAFDFGDHLAGQAVTCPACGTVFVAFAPADEPLAPTGAIEPAGGDLPI